MQEIKLYFAGDIGGINAEVFGSFGITNRLVSYLYPRQFVDWISLPDMQGTNLLLDSGAFSAWNKGSVISIDAYIAHAKEALSQATEKGVSLRVVNLDVIPGNVGMTKGLTNMHVSATQRLQNYALIEAAASQGYKNLQKFLRNGITPIHVYHQGERRIWLDRMLGSTDYIGISPANDMPQFSKYNWICDTFEYLYKKNSHTKTHGFAVMATNLLKDIPWTSCDAASWVLSSGMGTVTLLNQTGSLNLMNIHTRYLSSRHIEMHPQLFTGMSLHDVQESYQCRRLVNVRAIQLLEKRINVYKRTTPVQLRDRLL